MILKNLNKIHKPGHLPLIHGPIALVLSNWAENFGGNYWKFENFVVWLLKICIEFGCISLKICIKFSVLIVLVQKISKSLKIL